MLLDMQITMPSQDPMAEQEFSLAPRKIRKWINALPYIDPNVAAMQFYDGLRRSNRQAHETKQRLIAIELMRPIAREFLKQQRKYLVAQSFPLSKKATEILKLQQNILSELAVAYKIIIQETVNRDIQLSSKKLIMCVHHTMRYMLEQYVTLSQVYSEPPKGYWQDYCQLYKMAEHLKLSHTSVKNEEHANAVKSSANCLFKQACLLSLANLHTFGHGEAEKISAYLESMSHLVTLSDEKHIQDDNSVYFINLALNKPPKFVDADDIPISSENRFLDSSKLINELHEIISSKSEKNNETILSSSNLNRSLAKRLLTKIAYKSKRSEKRATSSSEKLCVVLGLRDAINTLLYSNDVDDEPKNESLLTGTNLELLPIENSLIDPRGKEDREVDKWGWLGRNNEMNEELIMKSTRAIKAGACNIVPVIQSWEISNASNGGYCLKSDNTSDYQSQVGDLILLRLEDSSNDEWRAGIVRWMQSIADKGVKIGIETLKGTIAPVKVIDAHFAVNKFKGIEHILQLSEESNNDSYVTFIAPPNSINLGESLDIIIDDKTQTIQFQNAIERTISFVRFTASVSEPTD